MRNPQFSLDGMTGVLTVSRKGFPRPLLASDLEEKIYELERKLAQMTAHRDAWQQYHLQILFSIEHGAQAVQSILPPAGRLEWE